MIFRIQTGIDEVRFARGPGGQMIDARLPDQLSELEQVIVAAVRRGTPLAHIAKDAGVTRQAVQQRVRSPRLQAALKNEPIPPRPHIGRPRKEPPPAPRRR